MAAPYGGMLGNFVEAAIDFGWIILWGRTEHALKATSNAVQLYDVNCSYMLCDVGNRDQVHNRAEEVRSQVGDVTMLINNAGVVYGDTVVEAPPENIQQTLQTNTLGQVWCIKEFLPRMIEGNHGHIVCINSMLGLMGLNGAADYAASKFALTGFMDSLDMELATEKTSRVYTTSIHPYLIDTAMFAGCKTRFPFLFPSLRKEYVVDRTIEAIERNESTVLMPRIMYLFTLVRMILPRKAFLITHKFAGVDKAMDNFHGRKYPIK